jgi:4-hydroxythreonine-4-phosphate dehydrogenase
MTLPRIGVTLGDPGGIGPEVVLKAFGGRESVPEAAYIIFGDHRTLDESGRALGLRLNPARWDRSAAAAPGLCLAELAGPAGEPVIGRPARGNGEASFRFFAEAVESARRGLLDAVVTGPISKEAWHMAGLSWVGHTDYLKHLYPGAVMTFWSDRLKVALLSHHAPIRRALDAVRKDAIVGLLRTLQAAAGPALGGAPEFIVAGLNPHAGEGGLLGPEEEREIGPAIEEARHSGINASGPYPPDTAFLRALGRPNAMAVAMYHDQGLIAFKLEAFASGVNATLGLPFARTSPDHGTAFDIAGKGTADPRSMVEAVKLAWRFAAA